MKKHQFLKSIATLITGIIISVSAIVAQPTCLDLSGYNSGHVTEFNDSQQYPVGSTLISNGNLKIKKGSNFKASLTQNSELVFEGNIILDVSSSSCSNNKLSFYADSTYCNGITINGETLTQDTIIKYAMSNNPHYKGNGYDVFVQAGSSLGDFKVEISGIFNEVKMNCVKLKLSNLCLEECTPQPTNLCQANFGYNQTGIENEINFVNTTFVGSSSADQYQWDFGDGGTSALQNPIHQYLSPGNYTVCMYIVNSTTCDQSSTLSFCGSITVTGSPSTATCLDLSNYTQNDVASFNDISKYPVGSTVIKQGNISIVKNNSFGVAQSIINGELGAGIGFDIDISGFNCQNKELSFDLMVTHNIAIDGDTVLKDGGQSISNKKFYQGVGYSISYEPLSGTNFIHYTVKGNFDLVSLVNFGTNFIKNICLSECNSTVTTCEDLTQIVNPGQMDYLIGDTICTILGHTVTNESNFGGFWSINSSHSGLYGADTAKFHFDGSNQVIKFTTYYLSEQIGYTGFSVNGSPFFMLNAVFPITLLGVTISLDKSATDVGSWEYSYITFTGNISYINWKSYESGITDMCVTKNTVSNGCEYFTARSWSPKGDTLGYTQGGKYPVTNVPYFKKIQSYGWWEFKDSLIGFSGMYGVTSGAKFDFDGTSKTVTYSVYGNDYQYFKMGFSVNGSAPIALDSKFPMTVSGVTIELKISKPGNHWTSSYLSFSGNIKDVEIYAFESGITEMCITEYNAPQNCNASAEFIYTLDGTTVTVTNTSMGTYAKAFWNFGDGTGWYESTGQSYTYTYTKPGAYFITLGLGKSINDPHSCDSIGQLISCTCSCPADSAISTINIITPDGDGKNDKVNIPCSNSDIYNRYGVKVKSLFFAQSWDGRDNTGNTVPMGEYIVVCKDGGTVINVTVIR